MESALDHPGFRFLDPSHAKEQLRDSMLEILSRVAPLEAKPEEERDGDLPEHPRRDPQDDRGLC